MSIGFLGTLITRLTQARAAALDNLNATISSRASASHYTSSRAGKIDNLDTTISSRASAANLATVDSVVDAIKVVVDDIDAEVDSIKTTVEAIETETKTMQAFTTAGSHTWTRPSGVDQVSIICVGGGGSGALGPDYAKVSGGAGAEVIIHHKVPVTANLSINIGAGGAAVSGYQPNGHAGSGSSVWGGYVTMYAHGGGAGQEGGSDAVGGGSVNGGMATSKGGDAFSGGYADGCVGFGIGGSKPDIWAPGGGSYGGGGAGAVDDSSDGSNGLRGSGGGAAHSYQTSGAGGDGFVVIFWEA